MRRVFRAIAVGETVHVHGFPGNRRDRRHRVGWSGYVHAVDANYGEHIYLVSQRDPMCWASKFWIPRDEVFPGIWTFEGFLCLRCKERIR